MYVFPGLTHRFIAKESSLKLLSTLLFTVPADGVATFSFQRQHIHQWNVKNHGFIVALDKRNIQIRRLFWELRNHQRTRHDMTTPTGLIKARSMSLMSFVKIKYWKKGSFWEDRAETIGAFVDAWGLEWTVQFNFLYYTPLWKLLIRDLLRNVTVCCKDWNYL